jgi:hypothetical protein
MSPTNIGSRRTDMFKVGKFHFAFVRDYKMVGLQSPLRKSDTAYLRGFGVGKHQRNTYFFTVHIKTHSRALYGQHFRNFC